MQNITLSSGRCRSGIRGGVVRYKQSDVSCPSSLDRQTVTSSPRAKLTDRFGGRVGAEEGVIAAKGVLVYAADDGKELGHIEKEDIGVRGLGLELVQIGCPAEQSECFSCVVQRRIRIKLDHRRSKWRRRRRRRRRGNRERSSRRRGRWLCCGHRGRTRLIRPGCGLGGRSIHLQRVHFFVS